MYKVNRNDNTLKTMVVKHAIIDMNTKNIIIHNNTELRDWNVLRRSFPSTLEATTSDRHHFGLLLAIKY